MTFPAGTKADSVMPPMIIGGRAVTGGDLIEVTNPATGLPFAAAPACTVEHLEAAMAAAAEAFPGWSSKPWAARQELLLKAADALDGGLPDLATLLSQEQGKALPSARREVEDLVRGFRAIAALAIADEVVQEDDKATVTVRHVPLGVVAAITPWNFPLLLMGMKLAPALLAGNTVVLKPSPFTPLATLVAGRLIAGVLPAGVLNVISGGNDIGALMTSHVAVRKVSFTGSVSTGLRVAVSAAADLKRYTLELGGNDAAIVLDDVDLASATNGIFWGAFTNSGQICAGIKRLYVPASRHDEIVEALVQRATRVRMGDGAMPGIHLGPINNRMQFERVTDLVDEALAGGARAVIGGRPEQKPGYFYPLTILTDVHDDMRIVREEQFGPVLPVLSYSDLDDAVRRANDTEFGLSGSVWGADTGRAAAVAARLECGTRYVNTHLALEPHIPFGGTKRSGVGVENGPWGLREFMDIRVDYHVSSKN